MDIINAYGLKYDIEKESVQMSFPKPAMVDRRKQALGYPGHGLF